jgi:sRNA-binding carbon storage regulator CsrA
MLVLTRRAGETIVIGDLVELRLIEAKEHCARLAIRFLKANTPILKVTLVTDQSVEIGDHVTVMAVVCSGDHTRIGIAAPPEMPIVRGEVQLPFNKRVEQDSPGGGSRDGQET